MKNPIDSNTQKMVRLKGVLRSPFSVLRSPFSVLRSPFSVLRSPLNLKKKLSVLTLTAAAIALTLAGCTNDSEPPPPPQTVATPTATPASGEVADNTPITLATTTAGAAIHYTQDGTEPTAASALYSDTDKPVITTGKLTLKAVAVKSGMNNSAVLTATYTIATVIPPEPTPPTASITNNNQTVTLAPELEITLNGTATKGTNEIYSYEWTVKTTESGVTPVFTSGTTLATKVTGIKKAGTYVFELKVKDTADLEGKAEATVVVNGYQVTESITVEFVPLYPSFSTNPLIIPGQENEILDFSSSTGLPSGVTYKITNDKTNDTWGTLVNASFNGKVTAAPYFDDFDGALEDTLTTFSQIFYFNGEEIIGINSKRTVKVYTDNFPTAYFVQVVSDTGSVTLTLTKTITKILPPPVTKTVTVTFPEFALGNASANFSASYAPVDSWDTNFSASDITYTLTDTLGHTWNNVTGFVVNATDGPYIDGTTYNFTQTFKDSTGTVKGSQVIRIRVNYGGFVTIRDVTDTNTGATTIPPVTLTLTKQ
jgi:hypothetical protein